MYAGNTSGKFGFIGIVVFTAIIMTCAAAFGATLSIEPSATTVLSVSQDVTLKVQVKDVTKLGGFQFNCFYDSNALELISVKAGDFLTSTGRKVEPLGTLNISGGVAFGVSTTGSQDGPTGEGVLAEISFKTKAVDIVSEVRLTNIILVTSDNPPVNISAPSELKASFRPKVKIEMAAAGSPGFVALGNKLLYQIRVMNSGFEEAPNAVLTLTYPAETEFVSASPAPDTGLSNKWTLGAIAGVSSKFVYIMLKVKDNAALYTTLNGKADFVAGDTGQYPASATLTNTTDADTDGDGSVDSYEKNMNAENNPAVVVLYSAVNGATIVMETDNGAFSGTFSQVPESVSALPDKVSFPAGLTEFNLTLNNSQKATVTIKYPGSVAINSFWKFGATADNPADHWYEFKYNGQTGAVLDPDNYKMTLYLKDGDTGDNDRNVNGKIVNVGGLALKDNAKPNKPVNTTPYANAAGVSLTPSFIASPFADADLGNTHLNSQWRVCFDKSCDSIVHNSGKTAASISYSLQDALTDGSSYYWQVRYRDNYGSWSDWSDVTQFTVGNNVTPPVVPVDTGTTDWTSYADSAAAFTVQPITGNAPLTVSFDTQGTIGELSFDYGDGTTGKALSHTYTQPGTYKVVLTATGISGYKTLMEKTVTVTQAPCVAVANFTVQPENGQAPLSVSLNTDGSTGELSFDYGDGITGKELSHIYSQPGTYTIILTAAGVGECKNTMQKSITVTAAPCVAAAKIKATPASGTVPFTVSFDASESQGQTYQWNFGDGSTATGQIQSHTYTNPGTYAVVLTVKGAGGCANSANMAIEALAVSKPTITMTSEREFQAGNYKEPPAKVIWEIFTDTMTVFRAETTGLSLKLPELFLNKDTDYQCRMMSVDSNGNLSAWSEPLAFRVSTPDAGIQTGALKIETVNRNDTLLSLKYSDSQAFSDIGKPAYLPLGLAGFKLKTSPGGIAQVMIRFPEAVTADAKWYRYDEMSSRYEEYSHAVFAQDRKAITVEIRDGGFGDADGVENGVIVSSPSGYGTSVKTPADAVVPPSQSVTTDDGGGGGCFINSTTSGLPSWFGVISLIVFAFLLCIRKIQNI